VARHQALRQQTNLDAGMGLRGWKDWTCGGAPPGVPCLPPAHPPLHGDASPFAAPRCPARRIFLWPSLAHIADVQMWEDITYLFCHGNAVAA